MSISMRMIDWSFLREPLQRSRQEENTNIFVNALNLMFNFRGIGWTWADRTYCPPETRPINSRGKYTFDTFLWFITSLIFFDAFNYAVIGLSPPGVGTPSGHSIFDASLPLFPRYAMSTLITLLYGGVFYFSLEMVYYFANFVACLLPHFNASDWPPLSEAPWRATSLARFWGKHWHQSYHRSFIALAKPLRALFGREGSIMGAFLISAILHDWCIWGMGKGTNFTQTGGFFVLMGLGIILEHMWEWITSKKAGGVWGWLWTATWLLGCGNLVVDAWMKTGLGGGDLLPPNARPAKAALDYIFRAMQ
ncbi:hypothetical protein PHLCEN_2v4051 [Hermanssonia centrifuga]|uniref:Wax synthase domain-containing protein n=1 Tax=Hermanssonia centrifuga TaxID=98765 RepID=A0A2R6Q5I4_9APHY|nr:hypothetical protein PHLCEN_2v4051 [Hermanssonia centrifuga]